MWLISSTWCLWSHRHWNYEFMEK